MSMFGHLNVAELRDDYDRLTERRRRLLRQAGDLADRAKAEDREPTDGEQEKIAALSRGVDRIGEELEGLEYELTEKERHIDYVKSLARDPKNVERSDDAFPDNLGGRTYGGREDGLRTIERHEGILSREAADNLDHIVRNKDPLGVEARYIAVGDPSYLSAFGKIVADPMHGHLRHDPREVEAMRKVNQVETERALVTSTGSAGGFAIPFTLDPTILLSSSGVLNPVRQVARTFTIATKEWKGVSSDGVTVAYVFPRRPRPPMRPRRSLSPRSRRSNGAHSFHSQSRSVGLERYHRGARTAHRGRQGRNRRNSVPHRQRH